VSTHNLHVKKGVTLEYLLLIIIIGTLVAFIYEKVKRVTVYNNQNWVVIEHAFEIKQLYEKQNQLRKMGIKSRVEFDDTPLVNALKGHVGKADSVVKLFVLEEDAIRAKEVINSSI
jgi:hypothetical protein